MILHISLIYIYYYSVFGWVHFNGTQIIPNNNAQVQFSDPHVHQEGSRPGVIPGSFNIPIADQ